VTPPRHFPADALTKSLMQSVETRFKDHPGQLESFAYPVTRDDAIAMMKDFFASRIDRFGEFQDAMMKDEPWMAHSLLSATINLGLLSAKEVIDEAMQTYQKRKTSLASIEGFIRQILGWREYVRGVYLVEDDAYLTLNKFNHHQALPDFYYHGQTAMQCLQSSIHQTLTYGYNHHIQRLMVLSNYANLIEVEPSQVNRWFNEMYIDSFEWIVAANVIGMGMHADGGKMSTKPYISSGAYIDTMSNYCQDCAYVVTLKTGDKACPFNSLYWQFIHKNKAEFSKNPRMAMMVKVFEKMEPNKRQALLTQAKAIIHGNK
jgi:deoxyribodipyrimidine photolyase-related protein